MQKKVSLHKLENVFFLLVFLSGVAIFYGSSTVSDFLSSTTLTAKTYGMIVSGCLTVASGAKLLLNLAGAVKKEKQEMISFAEVPRMVICAVAMVVYAPSVQRRSPQRRNGPSGRRPPSRTCAIASPRRSYRARPLWGVFAAENAIFSRPWACGSLPATLMRVTALGLPFRNLWTPD